MSTEKRYVFNFWIATVFIYLFIKMYNLLGKPIVDSKVQLLILYFVYGLGVVIAALYGRLVISQFAFRNILFVIFGVISTLLFGLSRSNLFQNIITMSFWLVVMLVCYSCNEILRQSRFVVNLMLIFDLLMSVSFYVALITGGQEGVDSVNAVYFIACLFPVIFLDANKYLKLVVVMSSAACVLLSGKRTALIVLVLAFAVPYLFKLLHSNANNKVKSILILILLSLLVIYLYDYLLKKFDLTIFDRFSNIAEDGGSGRIDIYKAVIASFKESGFLNKLFGHGFNGVFLSGITCTSAHNDFLEVLYDFGIIGEIFYLCLVVGMISTASKLLKRRAKTSLAVVSAIMVFICMSTTSHLIIYPTYFIYIILFIMMGQSELLGRN